MGFRAYNLRLATANGWFYDVPPAEGLSESWRRSSYRVARGIYTQPGTLRVGNSGVSETMEHVLVEPVH